MLAVDENYRKRKIGATLVKNAIEVISSVSSKLGTVILKLSVKITRTNCP